MLLEAFQLLVAVSETAACIRVLVRLLLLVSPRRYLDDEAEGERRTAREEREATLTVGSLGEAVLDLPPLGRVLNLAPVLVGLHEGEVGLVGRTAGLAGGASGGGHDGGNSGSSSISCFRRLPLGIRQLGRAVGEEWLL